MRRFEYKVTRHPAAEFRELAFVCSAGGECKRERIPADQVEALERVLNESGDEGWEVVQLVFSRQMVVIFWKREKK